jgi:hypothetical protein
MLIDKKEIFEIANRLDYLRTKKVENSDLQILQHDLETVFREMMVMEEALVYAQETLSFCKPWLTEEEAPYQHHARRMVLERIRKVLNQPAEATHRACSVVQ